MGRKFLPQFFRTPAPTQDSRQSSPEECNAANPGVWAEVRSEFSQSSCLPVLLSFLAGLCWASGLITSVIGGRAVGFALSFALSQTCPLMASFWGLVLFGEFSGPWVPLRAKVLLAIELLLYLASMGCLLMCRLSE